MSMIANRFVECEYGAGYREYVLSSQEEQISLGGHEVLIKVSACNISQIHNEIMMDLLSKNPQFCHSPCNCVGGVVTEAGNNVTSVKKNDRVVGFVPLDSARSGCANFCVLNDFDTVMLQPGVDFVRAVAVISGGIKVYHALRYLCNINQNDTMLILDAGSAYGSLSVQLAKVWGAKVLAVAAKHDKLYLENLPHPPDRIIEIDSLSNNLAGVVLKETGNLGANIIIDDGVRLFSNEDDCLAAKDDLSSWKPLKHEIISCLAPGGRWVTSNPLLQIDPADSLQLFLLGASVNYLFEHVWNLSPTSQGKLIHIVKDLMSKLEERSIEPRIYKIISFDELAGNGRRMEHADQTIVSVADS